MKREDGFTLPELLVALAVSIGLVIAMVAVSKPSDFSDIEQRAERQTNIARISQGIERYKTAEGHLPDDLPTKPTPITIDSYDLCRVLVPKYLKDIPIDSRHGIKTVGALAETDDPCDAKDVEYYSGYTIVQNKDGSVTIAEEEAVGKPIKITR